ncbi:hypothetical protein GCM10007886_33200 [Methylobacterium gregans]|nr:hypothetical protein GCM10007886_33200 [Methylobacterium gregans]
MIDPKMLIQSSKILAPTGAERTITERRRPTFRDLDRSGRAMSYPLTVPSASPRS